MPIDSRMFSDLEISENPININYSSWSWCLFSSFLVRIISRPLLWTHIHPHRLYEAQVVPCSGRWGTLSSWQLRLQRREGEAQCKVIVLLWFLWFLQGTGEKTLEDLNQVKQVSTGYWVMTGFWQKGISYLVPALAFFLLHIKNL